MDFVSTIPFDTIFSTLVINADAFRGTKLIRMIRLVRLFKIFRLLKVCFDRCTFFPFCYISRLLFGFSVFSPLFSPVCLRFVLACSGFFPPCFFFSFSLPCWFLFVSGFDLGGSFFFFFFCQNGFELSHARNEHNQLPQFSTPEYIFLSIFNSHSYRGMFATI